jgi:glycosyltransferase involved in cell wall biosynthesis
MLLYLGALREYEGLELLVEAFPLIRRQHPAAQLVLVGDGEARARIAACLGDGVYLLPPIPHEETPRAYAAADVVVYPRLSDRATERVTPLKPLEAMAMGKAIVASDVGGLRELLADGETARLFPAGSGEACARACVDLLAEATARARLGRAAREAALRYDWGTVVPRYLEVYRRLGISLP